jgi:hypothetical protein
MEHPCFRRRTLIYPSPTRNTERWELVKIRTGQLALAVLLVAVSVLALQPPFTQADQRSQLGTLALGASGLATPIGKGNSGSTDSATLSLNGIVYSNNGGQFKSGGITGWLEIGSTNYTLSDGQGEENSHGRLQIGLNANGGKHHLELILNGNMQGNDVNFTSPQSKLSDLYFLSLNGQITLSPNSPYTYSHSNKSEREYENHNHNVTVTLNQTVTESETITLNQTVTENNTVTVIQSNNVTITVTENQTVTETSTRHENVTTTVTETAT